MKHLTIKVPHEQVNLYPFCDIQVGAHGVDETGFTEYAREATNDPYGRIIGVGDYTDGVSPSNRKLLLASFVKGELYDVARDMLDDAATNQLQRFQDMIEYKAWDVVIGGHHYWEYQPSGNKIENTDQRLAKYVNAPYVDAGSVVMISYVMGTGKSKSILRVLATHGLGGTSTYAGPLNQLEKLMRAFNAHVYIVGHHHKLVAARAVKLDEKPNAPTKLLATDSVLVGAGSWMHGYLPDEVTYAEAGLMVPLATGAPIVRVARRSDGTFKIRAEI